jgi:hypothetical protein
MMLPDAFYWVGHAACESPTDIEKELIAHKSQIEFIGGVSDDNLSYEYDEFAVIRYKRKLYLLETSGCSCPDPSETWRVVCGPTTKTQLVKEIKAGNYQGYTLPKHLEADLILAIENGRA